MFKAGDRVRRIKNSPSINPKMVPKIGKIYTVNRIAYPCVELVEYISDGLFYRVENFELVTDKEIFEELNKLSESISEITQIKDIPMDNPKKRTIGSEQNIMIDIDDTLVMHVHDNSPAELVLYNDMMEANISLNIHHEHVNQIKSHKNRGYTIFIWSGNGKAWAEKVINELKLQDYVDYIMTKPVKFFDDLPAQEVLVNRVYLPYKKS